MMSMNPLHGALNAHSALSVQKSGSGHPENRMSSFLRLSESLQHSPVNPDVPATSAPTAQAVDETADAEKGKSALQQLREYMEMTPAERIRASMLNELELTEEELEKLPLEEQEAIERVIAQRIEDILGNQARVFGEQANAVSPLTPASDPPQQRGVEAIKLYQAISLTTG